MPPLVLFAASRRRRRASDTATLVAALGGDANVAALYDARFGITLATGVSQWDDARGSSGFGPSLVQATTTKQPAWDAVAQTLTFDGVDDDLATAASALFDLSGAKTVVLVGAVLTAASTKYAFGIADAATVTRALVGYVNTGTSRFIGELIAASATSDATGLAIASATRRMIAVSKAADGSLVVLDVPNQARATFVHSGTAPAGNNTLVVGSRWDTLAGMPSVVRAVLVLNSAVAPADVATLSNWAQVNHGALPA